MRSSDGEGRSIRRDALYPALSGEWEVPVTRNAKITPVNEGGGGGVGGPPLRDHLWQGPPVTRNAEIDPGDNDPPPKMTQGGNDPPNPPSSPSTASLSRVARCWHSNAYFSLFLRYFSSTHRTNLSRFRGTFHSFDPVGFAIFAIPQSADERLSDPFYAQQKS